MGVDLHLHSTASDGTVSPERVPTFARDAGLHTIALTDHDTVDGLIAAIAGGDQLGIRVITGCEFSVAAWWGELHLLGYFLPLHATDLQAFLLRQQADREQRIGEMLSQLAILGVSLDMADVATEANGGAMGRPHVARALVKTGAVASVQEAFNRYIADGGKAFVPRRLTDVSDVVALVRALGGVTSAAHLKGHGTRQNLERLREIGVDAIEVRHPAHDARVTARLHQDASHLGMLMTGGSDWHGATGEARDMIGAIDVPESWLHRLETLHEQRAA